MTLREEIVAQLDAVRGWGGRFVTAVPQLTIAKPRPGANGASPRWTVRAA